MKVLHIIATPRGEKSNTLQVSAAFLDALAKHRQDIEIDVVNLFNADLPSLAGDNIEAKYTLMMGQPIDPSHEPSWRQIELLISRFLAADVYLISAPMWNFGIPYALKYYIDCIVQPGYLFEYNEMGYPVPLVQGKKMVCVTARGGDYSPHSPMHALDFQEPYLKSIFGFIGVTDLQFISLQPTDISTQRESAFAGALQKARSLADSVEWRIASQ
ncbi:FMN-dependent NADH-azoreductase [Catelliglobosispora koreensis]|uniref:FMN-dependent NADH-azoreductase n=1 Tax=Catelliglobosispora koreensis TaxID=129052 RepID=UPI000590CF61|nr:NAD(P)H-dependent oxidoreductase [Catelliglobosispora koreensis]